MAKVLIIGGTGRLGRALAHHLYNAKHGVQAVGRDEIDVTNTLLWFPFRGYDTVINCAAVLSIPAHRSKSDRLAYMVNALGAHSVARLTARMGIRLVHISTDYVFDGSDGNYDETSLCRPVNAYGLSKVLGEEFVASAMSGALILRAPFVYDGPWPYKSAFTDQWTSRRWMREVVPDIVEAALDPGLSGILHIGGPKRTVYELAKTVSPGVGEMVRADWTMFDLPRDVSLDSSRWARYKAGKAVKRVTAK